VTKILALFLFLVAAIQVIKPLGWPGLKKRADAWKLVAGVAAVTVASVVLTALFQGL
jgi:low affinity Fe/Cu permease